MSSSLRRLATQLLVTASAPVGAGSQRNALAALQSRYDAGRDDREILRALARDRHTPPPMARRTSA